MIKVVAKGIVKEDKIEEFKEIAYKLIEETRKENGNISYFLYEDIKNSKIITFIEEWKEEKALEEHFNTKHFIKLVPKLRELQESETEVNVYKEI